MMGRLPDVAGYKVLATLENTYGQRACAIIFTGYGDEQWHCNHKEFDLSVWKAMAWMPLPEPYRKSEEAKNAPSWKNHIMNRFLEGK